MIAYTVSRLPRWNPINICSYHLQEAGATPVQEIAYAMSTAIAVLDAVRDSGQVPRERMGDVVGRISFFVNAGVRFVEEMCKMRAFGRIWDQVTRERYGIENPRHRRFRYGVQVNSLGLTEAQPENNVQRIVLEMLAVTLSKDARARAVQLPAWNEALGLPRPWDQQWSLRIQQVLAYESDLLEYDDIFEGSKVIEEKVERLVADSFAEMGRIEEMGGAMAAVESGYLKSRLVSSHAERRARIESGEEKIIGVNAFEGTEPNPLTADLDTAIQTVDPAVEARVIASLENWRDTRYQPPFNHPRPCKALEKLKEAARGTANLMEATLECARAGATTGEWAGALREVFGEFRAPTGVSSAPVAVAAEEGSALSEVRRRVELTAKDLGVGKLRFLVGKPGLDGHSNGAEQIAVRARDAGFEVVYQGIRLTPEQIVDAALAEDVHAVGLSILSGSHARLVPDVLERLRVAGATDIPVIAGGIIPNGDAERLRAAGVAAVFTPKDFDITGIIGRIVDEIRNANKLDPWRSPHDDRQPASPSPFLPGRTRLEPALPGEGPGPPGRPGLPGPGGRVRAAGQARGAAHHRQVPERGRLDRQDPRGARQRLDHGVDVPGRRDGRRGAGQNLDCVMLPKVQTAEQIVALDLLLTQIEKAMGFEVGRIGIEAQIENARGLNNVNEIATASRRLETIVFGPADFMASINMKSLVVGEQPRGYPADAYHYILMKILMAARANDLQAIDGPYLQIRNVDGYREVARRAAALGFDGKWVLHPGQVEASNEIFSPSQEDYDHAELILDAYDHCTSEAGGRKGSAMLGDEMIDEASRKMALVISGKGRAAGMRRTSKFEIPEG
ncbi:hypothetical protein SHKM778_34020 [Streptomyces sp. KM77-8]|uniref:B12-binding domain-containing protein n=1 Tax=Streptomyces haneummycinicus TaxID=3074435 RepID=A0AAT9HI64_9ACTN